MAKIDPAILSSAGEALMAGNIPEAILACKSGGKNPFDEESTACFLELILTRTPQALADCPADYLPALRVAAALVELFGLGYKSIRDLVTVDNDYNYRHDPVAVGVMLLSYAQHLYKLSDLSDTGFTKVEVLSTGNADECAVCREANGKVFPIAEAPELPHPDCSCPNWCKCMVIATLREPDL